MKFFSCTAILLVLMSAAVQAEPVKLANGEWAPYQSEQLKNGGFITQFTKEAFAAAGYEVEFAYMPWTRGYEDAKDGKYDGSIIWSKNAEREADFLFSEPIIRLSTSLFQQKGKNMPISGMSDLAGKRVGGMIGYTYGTEEMEEAGQLKIQRVSDAENNMQKLMHGRLDFVLEDTDVGKELILNMNIGDKIEANPTTINQRDYYLIISKKSPRAQELIDAFNRGMAKLNEDGKLDSYREASARGEYKM